MRIISRKPKTSLFQIGTFLAVKMMSISTVPWTAYRLIKTSLALTHKEVHFKRKSIGGGQALRRKNNSGRAKRLLKKSSLFIMKTQILHHSISSTQSKQVTLTITKSFPFVPVTSSRFQVLFKEKLNKKREGKISFSTADFWQKSARSTLWSIRSSSFGPTKQ